ncbi:MAG: 3,4-dihydroxyphenylacetate 2,3-dioxygenase [Pseudomonadota bacterium]
MGSIVQAAKITHVPSIWMSHTIERFHGIRQSAIDGLVELGRRAKASGVETFVVFDVHWIVNQGFHVNAKARHEGCFTSHELPHMLADLDYAYDGDPELANAIATAVEAADLRAMAHDTPNLACEYGTLVPMHFMNQGSFARVVPVAANQYASIDEGRRMGEAVARAIAASGRKVSVLASGSLSHEFWPNAVSADGLNKVNGEFNRQVDLRVLDLWQQRAWSEFLEMLPTYATRCNGECAMIDTAMLFGALGWTEYQGGAEIITPYFGSSGTGQCNVAFDPPPAS